MQFLVFQVYAEFTAVNVTLRSFDHMHVIWLLKLRENKTKIKKLNESFFPDSYFFGYIANVVPTNF